MLSIIVPTKGRETFERTLRSIRLHRGHEVIVVSDGAVPLVRKICKDVQKDVPFDIRFFRSPKTENWGNSQRNLGMKKARGHWLMFIDDDDIYVPDAFKYIHKALSKETSAQQATVHIFRMLDFQYKRQVLWQRREPSVGNVGTPMLCLPNLEDFKGMWPDSQDYGSDQMFIQDTLNRWPENKITWEAEVITICRPEL
jgi:glycosyltransferase involved in cell wall biosynthesis